MANKPTSRDVTRLMLFSRWICLSISCFWLPSIRWSSPTIVFNAGINCYYIAYYTYSNWNSFFLSFRVVLKSRLLLVPPKSSSTVFVSSIVSAGNGYHARRVKSGRITIS